MCFTPQYIAILQNNASPPICQSVKYCVRNLCRASPHTFETFLCALTITLIVRFNFILLTRLCSRNHFIKVLEKCLSASSRARLKKERCFWQPLLIFFSCVLFLFPILQRHIRHVMPHILVRRTDDLSFVYQFLDPVC